jgi:hypothetical protein
VTLRVVGRVDARHAIAASIASGETTVVEPGNGTRVVDRLEAAAAGAAGDGRELAFANGIRAGLVGDVLSGHGRILRRVRCRSVNDRSASPAGRVGCVRVTSVAIERRAQAKTQRSTSVTGSKPIAW